MLKIIMFLLKNLVLINKNPVCFTFKKAKYTGFLNL